MYIDVQERVGYLYYTTKFITVKQKLSKMFFNELTLEKSPINPETENDKSLTTDVPGHVSDNPTLICNKYIMLWVLYYKLQDVYPCYRCKKAQPWAAFVIRSTAAIWSTCHYNSKPF